MEQNSTVWDTSERTDLFNIITSELGNSAYKYDFDEFVAEASLSQETRSRILNVVITDCMGSFYQNGGEMNFTSRKSITRAVNAYENYKLAGGETVIHSLEILINEN